MSERERLLTEAREAMALLIDGTDRVASLLDTYGPGKKLHELSNHELSGIPERVKNCETTIRMHLIANARSTALIFSSLDNVIFLLKHYEAKKLSDLTDDQLKDITLRFREEPHV